MLLVVLSLVRTEIGDTQIGKWRMPGFQTARIDLVGAEIAQRPEDWRDRDIARRLFHTAWCKDAGIPPHACETQESDDQRRARERWCEQADIGKGNCVGRFENFDDQFAEEWRVEREAYLANITRPDLQGRDLRRAEAQEAFLAGVDLTGARLQGANLSEAQLEGANLLEARLEGANLRWARLEGANLSYAQLEGADLGWARLQGANLIFAGPEGANLSYAQLEGANLNFAGLEGVDLEEAGLQSAAWAGATIGPSPAHAADFTGGHDLSQDQLAQVIGDENTILPRDENGNQLHVWSCWTEEVAESYIRIVVDRRKHIRVVLDKPDGSPAFEGRFILQPEYLRKFIAEEGWICPPGEQPEPAGTPAPEPAESNSSSP